MKIKIDEELAATTPRFPSVVVNVATTPHYVIGQQRLSAAMNKFHQGVIVWPEALPPGAPPHSERPYAFKAHALMEAASRGIRRLMWCDASIVPIAPLQPIWDHAAAAGVWIPRADDFVNYEWTADSAYPALFPEFFTGPMAGDPDLGWRAARALNQTIPHCATGAVAIDLEHEVGRAFLAQWYHFAVETDAFTGPWTNANYKPTAPQYDGSRRRVAPCGPSDVYGHRHDQTVASVIAFRLGIRPTQQPYLFSYPNRISDTTILVADGSYR